MKVALIGAGGYIGDALSRRLKNNGVDSVSFSSKSEGLFDSSTGILNDDFQLPKGTTSVVYLSQSPFYRDLPKYIGHLWGVNVISAVKMAELARLAGVSKFIYASTGNVYEPSFDPISELSALRRDDTYALSKVHAEEALALYKNCMDVSVVRIFGVYGPNQKDKLIPSIINSINTKTPVKLTPRRMKEDVSGLRLTPCFIEDLLDIFLKLLRQPVDILNLAGPEILSVKDIAIAIGDELQIKPDFEILETFRVSDFIADISLLKSIFNPEFTSFSKGIQQTLR